MAVPRLTPALRSVLGDRQVDPRQGTAVKKIYQKDAATATTPLLPETVTAALAELAGDVQEGLLAMAVGTGLQVMAATMNADVEAVCGPTGSTTRAATRCDTAPATGR